MKVNLALWDRLLRFVGGVLMASWAIAGGPWWGFFGIYLILSSAWGTCMIYSLFKLRTAPDAERPMVPLE